MVWSTTSVFFRTALSLVLWCAVLCTVFQYTECLE